MIGALIVLFGILATIYGFANLVSGGEAHRWVMYHRPDALRASQKAKLSWASRQLVKEFNDLPKDWRPAGVDILSIVKALDTKHGRETLDAHFCEWVYGKFGWKTYGGKDRQHCSHSKSRGGFYEGPCPGAEHVALHREFEGIKKALAEQETRIRLSSIAGDLDALEALKQHMAESREIINDTTKELS